MKHLIVVLLIMMLLVSMMSFVFADPVDEQATGLEITEEDIEIRDDVTMGTVADSFDKKMSVVAELLKRLAKPLMIVMFIVGALITVIGIAKGAAWVIKGVITMVVAATVYVFIAHTHQLLTFISGWGN